VEIIAVSVVETIAGTAEVGTIVVAAAVVEIAEIVAVDLYILTNNGVSGENTGVQR
jgi:hypothetical protein